MNTGKIYEEGVPSKRTGPIYNSVPYPTKIDPEAIAVLIATHTRPGDVVCDVFGGSCMTGVAARLCDAPTERMKCLAKEMDVSVNWGARKAVIYEISPMGALTGSVLCSPPKPDEFQRAAERLLERVRASVGWMYAAQSPTGYPGEIRYVIWSDVLQTPCCSSKVSLWEGAAERNPAKLKDSVRCPKCQGKILVKNCERATVRRRGRESGQARRVRKRVPVYVYGTSEGKMWSRPVIESDKALFRRVGCRKLDWVPQHAIEWGELYRSGYHTGVDYISDLYTARNLRVFSKLWAEIDNEDPWLRPALRLLMLSYNATHSTLMTRVVAKKDQADFSVTGAQSGVLYVSGLPVEKNLLQGIERKVKVFCQAFKATASGNSEVRICNASSSALDLPTNSVDYLFTDPPFGGYIPYAEINQVNEAWLGCLTDRRNEAIVSPSQGKGVTEYGAMLTKIFSEASRVLKPNARATVVFHSSKADVWRAVGQALEAAKFHICKASILDKVQVSFKQVVAQEGTRHDALFLLENRKDEPVSKLSRSDRRKDRAVQGASGRSNGAAADMKRAYSGYVANTMLAGDEVALDAKAFYRSLNPVPESEF